MNPTAVFRLMSLIPDRSARAQTGSVFSPSEAAACRYPDRLSYIGRFLHWLGPLDPMTKEDQQILGVRSSGGRPMESLDEPEAGEEEEIQEEESIQLAEAGTPIAPLRQPSTVGG